MSGKHPLANCNYGYWGGNPNKRVLFNDTLKKVLTLNYDKLMTLGLPMALWREATYVQSGLKECSCVKKTSKQPDVPCYSCYGTGHIPGYFKFGTRNYWASSIDSGWTLTNVVLDTTNRPYRFMLADNQLTGTAVSSDVSISVVGKVLPWEVNFSGYTRDGGVASSIVVEASVNSGGTWFPLANLEANNPTTQIRFRVTLTRNTATTKSPMFEIVRVRFPIITDIAGKISEPVIRVVPAWISEAEARSQYGSVLEAQGMNLWTLPLSFFDLSIDINSRLARIADDTFVEFRYGGDMGFRYAVNQFSYSEQFEGFSKQQLALRKVAGRPDIPLSGEVYYLVW